MYYFCTYFDQYYLNRGLALYLSLRRHCPSFRLWVLCMDEPCYDMLSRMDLPDIHLIALSDFERGDEELLRAKAGRTKIEYYFTCTPSLLLFILKNYRDVDMLSYLDADMFFHDNPISLYKEIDDASIGIIEHRFSPALRDKEIFGIYNVGYLFFRRDADAFACLEWWRGRCLEWCYDRLEDGKFADQKYLDDWPTRFRGLTVLKNKGVNAAPWNIANYTVSDAGGTIMIDEAPLILFHYHGLTKVNRWLYDPNTAGYKLQLSKTLKQGIFEPYINALIQVAHRYGPYYLNTTKDGSIRYQVQKGQILLKLWKILDKAVYYFKVLVTGNFIVVVKGRVL